MTFYNFIIAILVIFQEGMEINSEFSLPYLTECAFFTFIKKQLFFVVKNDGDKLKLF